MANLFDTNNNRNKKDIITITFEERDKSVFFEDFHEVTNKYLDRANVFASDEEREKIFRNSIEVFNFYLSEMSNNSNVSIQDDNKLSILIKPSTTEGKWKFKSNNLHFKDEFELDENTAQKIKELLYEDYRTSVKYATIGFIQKQ